MLTVFKDYVTMSHIGIICENHGYKINKNNE